MLLRHKVPTIFNIYMLDVICCALGCVILLWQVAHQEAEKQTAEAKQKASDAEKSRRDYEKSSENLVAALKDITELRASLAEALDRQRTLAQSLAGVEKERDNARMIAAQRQEAVDKAGRQLNISEERLKKLEAELAIWLASHQKITTELKGKEKINVELLAKLALANTEIESLTGKVKTSLADVNAARKKSDEQAALLRISQEDAKKLQKLLDSLQSDSKDAQTKLKLTELALKVRSEDLDKTRKELQLVLTSKDEARSLLNSVTTERDRLKKDLQLSAKEIAAINALMVQTKLDKAKLLDRIARLEADADQRFAGIPLTGENVVFLIDVSGSMMMKDSDFEDPDKWPMVCETLMKLMKSIPSLQRFQVILFSDKATHLFGNRDQWYKYEGAATAQVVRDALRKTKPEGNTNMHDAFEEAFRYRKLKLDTIYLFSDGLPNVGPGIPASVVRPTEAQKNHHLSKFVRDKLKTEWNRPEDNARDVRINAVGFYFESPDVGAFLWSLAREHKGNFVGMR